jgi:hypothetical protein
LLPVCQCNHRVKGLILYFTFRDVIGKLYERLGSFIFAIVSCGLFMIDSFSQSILYEPKRAFICHGG